MLEKLKKFDWGYLLISLALCVMGVFLIALNNDHSLRQSTDDTVSHREIPRVWRRARRIFGYDRTKFRGLCVKARVMLGVYAVNAASQHPYRGSTRIDCRRSGNTVNALGKTADHNCACGGKLKG